uniref:Major facilitator superfamily (MFS) profile domain-containing protein n=1 Tax=Timema bartmani TaxID=61472 RepID=A0A7R9FG21_9NEOP|nr:unnamed protein product [Timema bartmani]
MPHVSPLYFTDHSIPARYVLCLMLFFGSMVTFLLRVNINMAIVAMVARGAAEDVTRPSSGACVHVPSTINLTSISNTTVQVCIRLGTTLQPSTRQYRSVANWGLPYNLQHYSTGLYQAGDYFTTFNIMGLPEEGGEFVWDEMQQSLILGSFFWGYLLFQIPGGRLAEVYGPKVVLGSAVFINGVLSVLLPFATRLHWYLLLVIRVMQGVAQVSVYL